MQQVGRKGRKNPQLNRPRNVSLHLGNQLKNPPAICHHFLGLGNHLYPRLRRDNGHLASVKKNDPELLLQFAQLGTERGLGDKASGGSLPKVPVLVDGYQVFQLLNSHFD